MNDTPFMPTREEWEAAQKKILQLVDEHQADIERIARLETELEQLREAIRWIHVEEKLPRVPEGKRRIDVEIVWVYDKRPDDVHYGLTTYFMDESNLVVFDGDLDKTVIAWRYIPPILIDLMNPGRKP